AGRPVGTPQLVFDLRRLLGRGLAFAGPQRMAPFGDALRPIVEAALQAGVDTGQELRRIPFRLELAQRLEAVLQDALDRARRDLAGYGVVERGGEAVDVGPRAELGRGVLL